MESALENKVGNLENKLSETEKRISEINSKINDTENKKIETTADLKKINDDLISVSEEISKTENLIKENGQKNTKVGNIMSNLKMFSDNMEKLIQDAEFDFEFDEFEDLCKILVEKSQIFRNELSSLGIQSNENTIEDTDTLINDDTISSDKSSDLENIVNDTLYADHSFISDQDKSIRSAKNKFYAKLQIDGNFVLYNSSNHVWQNATWCTSTHSSSAPKPYTLKMQTDVNLVLKDTNGEVCGKLILQVLEKLHIV